MINEKRGVWTIREYVGKNKNGLKCWKCQCVCGEFQTYTTSYLNSSKILKGARCRRCGEARRLLEDEELKKKYVDKTIGTWTVLEFSGRNKYGSRIWLCQCTCGTHRTLTTAYFNEGNKRKATICKKCELSNLDNTNRVNDNIPNRFWQRFLDHSKKREIEVRITKEEAFSVYLKQEGKCALTEIPLHFTKLRTNYNRYTTASIDRIDSAKAYTVDNIQWVEKRINMMKQSYTQATFVELCKLVAKKFDSTQPSA
jgi:hypothetical protein